MVVRRWQQRAGPAVLALGVAALFGAGSAGADEVAWTPPACDVGESTRPAPRGLVTDATAGQRWWRLEPRLDASGAQVAQRVTVSSPAGGPARTVELASESFAAGPFGSFVLTGSDDGRQSALHLLDLEAGCARSVGTERDVIRRATIDPSGSWIYEFRVDRRTRADRGVWRRPLDGSSTPRRVLEPIAPDDRFGLTFSTDLAWSIEADRLVVQSCGAFACRMRVFEPGTEAVTLIDEPDLGELIGLAADRLVTYAACRGMPCAVVSTALSDRSRSVLVEPAGVAVLVGDDLGARVIAEDESAGAGHLRVVGLTGGELGRVEIDPGTRIVPAPARAQAAVGLPPGWVALTPEGPSWPDRGPASFLRPGRTGSPAAFEEV